MTGVQVGYSVADILAKAVFGLLIWKIAQTKSDLEEAGTQKVVYVAPSV